MKKVYIGGSLFSNKEIGQRMEDERLLKKIEGLEVFNPINSPFNQKTTNPTPSDIFWGDTTQVLKSDIITVDGDDIDKDSGLAFECGIAFGCNYMLNLIKDYAPLKVFEEINTKVPYKKAYTVISDIRQDSTEEEGLNKSWGHNVFTYGGLKEMGDVYRNIKDAVKEIENDIKTEFD